MDSPGRSLSKALTWRLVATVITFSLTLALSGHLDLALLVGSADTVLKFGAYYFHERIWQRIARDLGE